MNRKTFNRNNSACINLGSHVVTGHAIFFGILVQREVVTANAGVLRRSRVEIEGCFSSALQQKIGHDPAREVRNDVVAFPVASSLGQWIAPYTQAVSHVREALPAESQRPGAVRVIGFAEEEDGSIGFRHEDDYKPVAGPLSGGKRGNPSS